MTELLEDATRVGGSGAQRPLLFSGEQDVVAEEVHRTWLGAADWADEVVASLRPGERAIGALAFAPTGVSVMHQVSTTDALPTHRPGPAGPVRHQVVARPTEEEYAAGVREALARIADGRLRKVVLGRCLEVVSDPPLDPAAVVARLSVERPGKYVFSVPLGARPEDPVLLGASPELLVRRTGAWVASVPLAGSAPRSADPAEDRARAEALLDSAKDLAEHAFVVEAIVSALAPACVEVDAGPRPRLLGTDTMWHLATPIRARLDPGVPGPSALHLARLLHPTPAVGGVPVEPALAAIAEIEGSDADGGGRGPLAGAVGWVDGNGDGEFAVTIRAGVLDGSRLRLFAGAGIVAGSEPDAEVRETSAKLATMARAIGLNGGGAG